MIDAPSWGQLAAFAALGLAGSLHCAGMCGPLCVALGARGARGGHTLLAGYVVGKALCYSMLALALWAATRGLASHAPRWMELSRAVFASVAGVVMLGFAAHSLGWWRGASQWVPVFARRALQSALAGAQELPGPLRGVAWGIANGLLPCGLSWSAIALGAAGGASSALIGPALFGLCTAPSLLAIALGTSAVPLAWRVRGRLVAALVLAVCGAWTIARGWGTFAPQSAAKVLPQCCSDPLHHAQHASDAQPASPGVERR